MNSLIRTPTGLTIMVNGKTFTVDSTHTNYNAIVDATREKRWNDIANLISITKTIKKYVEPVADYGMRIVNGQIYIKDQLVGGIIAARILDMHRDGFDMLPMAKFLTNLYENPSNRAVEELYGWMEKNGITITDDGHLLAYKRVKYDYTSFYDGKTDNSLHTVVSMPRNQVDDRSENTCSHGLHFCAQSYLPKYAGGKGRVLLLKINPADVVSIPTDYNFAKGRACKYYILDELKGDSRIDIEVKDVMPQPVIVNTADINESNPFKSGYVDGYKDGRGKKANGASHDPNFTNSSDPEQRNNYITGYNEGRADGRLKLPKRF